MFPSRLFVFILRTLWARHFVYPVPVAAENSALCAGMPCITLPRIRPTSRETRSCQCSIVIGDTRVCMASGRQALLWKSEIDVDGDSMLGSSESQSVSHPPSRSHSFINSTTKPLNSRQAARRVPRRHRLQLRVDAPTSPSLPSIYLASLRENVEFDIMTSRLSSFLSRTPSEPPTGSTQTETSTRPLNLTHNASSRHGTQQKKL